MKVSAIIVAAGSGTRMQATQSKTLLPLGGVPAIRRAAATLCRHVDQLVVAIRPEEEALFLDALSGLPVQLVAGGATRRQSVQNALAKLDADCDIVLVHDGARPLISDALVLRLIEAAHADGAAVPALQVVDTVKRGDAQGMIADTVSREQLYTVQTPQAFKRDVLQNAYQTRTEDSTDDAGLVELSGHPVRLVQGERQNIKLTLPEDTTLAEQYIMAQRETRSGIGYDVHRLVENRRLVLCGVDIPHHLGLLGHSDADVALHALMDALLGACALGDIGQHFPDTEARYKGASSLTLLGFVREILAEGSFIPYNVDITIASQQPKLKDHIPLMRQNVADALGLPLERVSVKATTTEHLGFEGRQEGISALSVVTVRAK